MPPKIILLSSLAAREPHLSAYAASKRQGETTLQDKDLPWTVVRAPAVYGPGDRATLPLFRMFARGLALRPSWDGQFSLIYVDDLAAALTDLIAAAAATAPLELDDGHPGGHRWDDLKIVAEQLMGRRIRTLPVTPGLVHLAARATQMTSRLTGKISVFGPEKVREMIHPDWVSRSPKVDEICTWQPNIDLHQGFERTIAWYRKHLWL